ncbi:hypothetical protein KUCAC02_035278, partial [Chaenocephalus aceratus]
WTASPPYTMALIAKYIARHRLRETRLMDTIADFLVKRAEYLDSKVIQKLVFPFSRMSYRPCRDQLFFSRLEEVLELKAMNSPLATVNILMSLFQLGHFPGPVMHRVFSPAFISNVTNSPYALIVRRYLSLLDAAVELEHPEYSGPRLQDAHKEEGAEPLVQGGGASECFLPPGSNGGSYRAPEIYKQLSENSSTLSSPPSDSLAHPPRRPPGTPPQTLSSSSPSGRSWRTRGGADCGFYCEGGAVGLHPPLRPEAEQRHVRRVVLSVNDKWHYCHNSQVLVGSRSMRDRHLRLLGYTLLQLPYHELEKLSGIEDVKQYLHQKLLDL